MKIYSMTATFGKLRQQTLTLTPGLNVIQAPNEWGKSTWCAFLTAMLYGLDTRSHSTKTALSDKERYTPWSGVPMSGRIDLHWKGRDITIERRTKGRTVFGEFRAYETVSGLPVSELTAQNCGQILLGVEKTVFTRSALIRQTDLTVTQDEALRRRLNALVTTGDDSGTAEELERPLRELKNRCRYNRTGLLPQAEAEAVETDRKLRELEMLEEQSQKLRQRCSELEAQISQLENHRTALRYQTALENARKLEHAERQLSLAQQSLQALQTQCDALPHRTTLEASLKQLQALQYRWAQLQADSGQWDFSPEHPIFKGKDPEEIQTRVSADIVRYKAYTGWKPLLLAIAVFFILVSSISTALLSPERRIYGLANLSLGIILLIAWVIALISGRIRGKKMAAVYGSKDTDRWVSMAQDYVNRLAETEHNRILRQSEIAALQEQIRTLCRNRTPADAMQHWLDGIGCWDALEDANSALRQQREYRDLLRTVAVSAPAPQYPDRLELSDAKSRELLMESVRELRETQHRLGQCQGQMEAIGHRSALESHRTQITQRIRQLEETYQALEIALSTLAQARNALQRRFAPRITKRAQEILHRLTEGRYDRLVLGEDLTLQVNSRDEESLRTALWRSDGTADLLYLALRLAVAGELTPEAPLILDDALVRFDDRRLSRAMEVLQEEAAHRQIILFSCHSRESQYMQKKEP